MFTLKFEFLICSTIIRWRIPASRKHKQKIKQLERALVKANKYIFRPENKQPAPVKASWDWKSPTVFRTKLLATIGSILKKAIVRLCYIFRLFTFLGVLIFSTFWTSHFNKCFIHFSHMVSQEQTLKHNLGLSAQYKSW